MPRTVNINTNPLVEASSRGEPWRYLDLSGAHLGVRVEELLPGASSSVAHYHTAEEEHVLALAGEATLVLADERVPVVAGDHWWFPAGEETAHHLVNEGKAPFRFLVFGERRPEDVVVYPGHQVMMVKALDNRQVTYRNLPADPPDE